MSEIEKIKERLQTYKDISTHPVLNDVQTLLSSLKKEKVYIEQLRGALGYEVSDNTGENPEIHNGIAEALYQQLEKEKEQTDYFRLEVNRLTDELAKEKEKVKTLESIMTCDPDHWDSAYVNWATNNLESRLKDSEAKIQIYLQDIQHEQALSSEINNRLKKLVEAVELYHKDIPCMY